MSNRKGQIGETMTWIVATLIIVIILIFGIVIANGGGIIQGVLDKDVGYDRNSDIFAEISLNSYLLESNHYETLQNEGNLNAENGPLAQSVFKGLYENEGGYTSVWFGVSVIEKNSFGKDSFVGRENIYFEGKPDNPNIFGEEVKSRLSYFSSVRVLDSGQYAQLFINKKLEFLG